MCEYQRKNLQIIDIRIYCITAYYFIENRRIFRLGLNWVYSGFKFSQETQGPNFSLDQLESVMQKIRIGSSNTDAVAIETEKGRVIICYLLVDLI